MATAQIRITADTAQAERALGGLNNSLRNLAGIALGGIGVREFAAFSDSVTTLQNKLNQLTPGINDTGKQMSQLNDIVQSTGISMDAVGDIYFSFAKTAGSLGITQAEAAKATEAVAAAMALGGQSAGEASGALLQMGQALKSGVFQGDELRSVLEGMPIDVVQGLADRFGVTVGELKKLGSEGKITATAFTQAILDMHGSVTSRVEDLAPTFEATLNRIKSSIGVAFADSEVAERMTAALQGIADGLEGINTGALTEAINGFMVLGQIVATIFIAGKLKAWGDELFKLIPGLFQLKTSGDMVSKVFGGMATDFKILGATFTSSAPLIARLGAGFASLLSIGLRFAGWVGIFLAVVDVINWVGRAFFGAQGDVISFTDIFSFMSDVVQVAWYLFKELGGWLGGIFGPILSSIGGAIGWVASKFMEFGVIKTVIGWVSSLWGKLAGFWTWLKQKAGVKTDGQKALDRLMEVPLSDVVAQYNAGRPGAVTRIPLGAGTGGGRPRGGGATGPSNAELIDQATAQRNKAYQDLIKSQQDSLFLTQFEGLELESQTAILNANNQLVRDITDNKGRVIGQTAGLSALEQENLSLLVRQNAEAKARVEVTRSNTQALAEAAQALRSATMTAEDAAVEDAIFKNRQQYGSAYTAELEAQDRIQQRQIYNLNQQAQVARVLTDITRTRTQLEIAQAASSMFGNTQEGMIKQQQEEQQALEFLRAQGLISEQSYLDQRILMNQKAQDDILAYEQKIAQTRLQQGGVTNDAVLKAVSDMQAQAAMIQQGGIVGAQGVLGALTNVMGSMGQTSEKAFKAYKALAIAQAIISTYQAAAMAIAFPPGPPLSLIYVAGAVAAGMAQVAAIRAQKYSGRAVGGPVASNSPYIVGERGPELFVPGTAGNIVPNNQLGGGGEPVTVNFTILANDTRDFDQLLTSRQGLITQIIRDAQQERGTRIGF